MAGGKNSRIDRLEESAGRGGKKRGTIKTEKGPSEAPQCSGYRPGTVTMPEAGELPKARRLGKRDAPLRAK